MRIAPVSLNEDLRLQDLYSYDILDTEAEKEFDDLLEVAAQLYSCPIAAISFVDRDRQYLKATKGIDGGIRETTRDVAFCAHAILEKEVLLVKDATKDERFYDNPFVTGGLCIRFYAGAPIVSRAGYKLGTICVLDQQPHELKKEEMRVLTIISQQISKLLELRLKNSLMKKQAEEQMKLEKQLLHNVLLEQDANFMQISTELHENIAQGLAATKFYLELAEDSSLAREELIGKSRRNVETLVSQVRNLSRSITPTTLADFCLEELLQNMLSQFHHQTGIETKLVYEGARQLKPEVAMTVYRIVEEQLKNVRQHAKATVVFVNLQVYQCVYLSVKDNGVGIELKHFKKGVGLQKILSRVENLKGVIDISGCQGNGCELKITIPLQQDRVVAN